MKKLNVFKAGLMAMIIFTLGTLLTSAAAVSQTKSRSKEDAELSLPTFSTSAKDADSEFMINAAEILTERTMPFDNFIQVIDGKAEVVIEGVSHFLEVGQAMIIPAHARNSIKANVRFKMISTIIKSGYEDEL